MSALACEQLLTSHRRKSPHTDRQIMRFPSSNLQGTGLVIYGWPPRTIRLLSAYVRTLGSQWLSLRFCATLYPLNLFKLAYYHVRMKRSPWKPQPAFTRSRRAATRSVSRAGVRYRLHGAPCLSPRAVLLEQSRRVSHQGTGRRAHWSGADRRALPVHLLRRFSHCLVRHGRAGHREPACIRPRWRWKSGNRKKTAIPRFPPPRLLRRAYDSSTKNSNHPGRKVLPIRPV